MSEVPARLGEIDLDEPVYVICRSGVRSARVAAWLNENGGDAVNVAGGTLAWLAAGRPMEADGDARALRPLTGRVRHRCPYPEPR